MQFRKFGGAILNYGAGSFIPQLVGFVLLPLYTRFLTPADYGIADLCSSVGFLFLVISKLGLPGAVARFYFDFESEEELRAYIRTVSAFLLVESTLLTAATMGLMLLVGGKLFPEVPFYPYFFLAFLGAPLAVLPDIQRRLLQAKEEAGKTAVLNVSGAVTGIGLNVLFVVGLKWGAAGLLLSTVLTSLVFSVVALVQMRENFHGALRLDSIPTSLRYGLPLVPNHIGGWLLQLGGRVVLGSMGTASQLGVYAVACKFVQPLTVLEAAFTTAFVPVYFRLRKRECDPEAREQLSRLANVSLIAFICAFAAIACVMPGVLRLVTPKEYHAAGPMVWIVAAGVLAKVLYDVAGSEMYFAKKTVLVMPITIAGGLVAVASTAILVPLYGGTGAAVGTTVGLAATAFIGIRLNRKLYKLPLQYGKLVLGAMAGMCVAAAFSGLRWMPPLEYALAGVLISTVFSAGLLYSLGWNKASLKSLLASPAEVVAPEAIQQDGP
jgi:O-antigen/teichoic acid export membrane protein